MHRRLRATPQARASVARAAVYHRPVRSRACELAGNCARLRSTARVDFLKVDHFTPLSEFLHIKGRNFPEFGFRSSLRMTPMNREKFHGNRSARFSEIRNTDTQTDRRGNFIYIHMYRRIAL